MMLRYTATNFGNRRLLERVVADRSSADLTSNNNNGYAVEFSVGDCRDDICGVRVEEV